MVLVEEMVAWVALEDSAWAASVPADFEEAAVVEQEAVEKGDAAWEDLEDEVASDRAGVAASNLRCPTCCKCRRTCSLLRREAGHRQTLSLAKPSSEMERCSICKMMCSSRHGTASHLAC